MEHPPGIMYGILDSWNQRVHWVPLQLLTYDSSLGRAREAHPGLSTSTPQYIQG